MTVDGVTQLIKSVTVDGKEMPLTQEFLWYGGMSGDNSAEEKRASGAYIFRPDGPQANTIPTDGIQATIYSGIHKLTSFNDYFAYFYF